MIRDVCLPAYENEEQTFESLSSKALLMDWMGEIDDVGIRPQEKGGHWGIYPPPPDLDEFKAKPVPLKVGLSEKHNFFFAIFLMLTQ